ncbi:ABC transporter ATP-binding protein [Terrihabitans rhizophilus]|uniref:ABC transporter ATP-binding protein n=1 Tax=Terrihabitans rhizophilus TaxID=3092662 RepID=A0ABU4RP55_9HYPH|nr:ABC transporter ATP-binding protein [Terrihabitans sp. PJ23]MDX6805978.1 ABC transporter ATP-binding protein [Terrihabitans sp. PJ23]
MSAPLLQVSGLQSGYGDVQVVWNVDLAVQPGAAVALIGSNGAGKTTILRTLSGLLRPLAGRITFGGEDIADSPPATAVQLGLSHVPEGRRLITGLNVEDNLMLGAYLRRDGRAAIRADIERMYELFPRLAERRRQDATTMSGGEQQMCAIARGLMAAPRLLMIDELSLGLAPAIVDQLAETLKTVRNGGTSLLLVEQDVEIALELADHVYVIDQGRTVLDGPSALIANEPSIREAYIGS